MTYTNTGVLLSCLARACERLLARSRDNRSPVIHAADASTERTLADLLRFEPSLCLGFIRAQKMDRGLNP